MSKLLNLINQLPKETSDSTIAFLTEQFTVHRKNFFPAFLAAVAEGREQEQQASRSERLHAVAAKYTQTEKVEGAEK